MFNGTTTSVLFGLLILIVGMVFVYFSIDETTTTTVTDIKQNLAIAFMILIVVGIITFS